MAAIVITHNNGSAPMPNRTEPQPDPRRPVTYEIRIRGQLDRSWEDWFPGLVVIPEENGDTLLTGPVADQAALHGLLRKVRDLGVPLISVNAVEHTRQPSFPTSLEQGGNHEHK
jgi:hypothetical protein